MNPRGTPPNFIDFLPTNSSRKNPPLPMSRCLGCRSGLGGLGGLGGQGLGLGLGGLGLGGSGLVWAVKLWVLGLKV